MVARIRRVNINPLVFFHILRDQTSWNISLGIPKDARLWSMTLDPYTSSLNLFVEHDSFEEIDLDTVAPLLTVEFKRTV